MDPIPPLPTNDSSHGARRKRFWGLLAVLATAPLVWSLALYIFLGVGRHWFWWRWSEGVFLLLATVMAVAAAAGVVWFGLRRGWHRRRAQLWGWGIAAVGAPALLISAFLQNHQGNRTAHAKAVMGNLAQINAALGQYSLEFSERIFFTYDDFIGPEEYIKNLRPVGGEDYHVIFPLLRNWTDSLSVKLPDGRVEQRSGVLAVTLPDGRRVGYPTGLDVKETPQPDGVHVFALPDRSRLEITYRGGVPDGPFRAYRADGQLWGEATFAHGRVTGPCWVYLRNGTKFNENSPGTRRADHLGLK